MADLKDFVGKRILVEKSDSGDVFETEIAEVSPSGEYMRVGGGNWVRAAQYSVVEELAPIELSDEEKPTDLVAESDI